MPNHVHVLIEVKVDLATIVQGWKSYTARWALAHNEELALGIPNRKRFWVREYWDRYIRNEKHFENVRDYIHGNPVKAGLCRREEEWRWSSAGRGSEGEEGEEADEDVGAPGDVSAFGRNFPASFG